MQPLIGCPLQEFNVGNARDISLCAGINNQAFGRKVTVLAEDNDIGIKDHGIAAFSDRAR